MEGELVRKTVSQRLLKQQSFLKNGKSLLELQKF